jgi:tetratricopeptide (TPR) repeat protein
VAAVAWALSAPIAAQAQPAAHPAVPAAADRAQALAQARFATERRDFATALPLFEQLAERAPGDADLLIEAARVFGWADRHARAAALYRQALAAAPARRRDIVPSLAWQTLWAGDGVAALPLLAEAARLLPGDRALGWALANALNSSGRHREALTHFQRWAPAASEAERFDLARAWRWAGFEDRAWPLVQQAQSADAAWQRDHRFARDVRPYGFGTVEATEDRDGLRTRAAVLGAGLRPMAGMSAALGVRHVELEDTERATATTLEASGRWRLGEADGAGGTWWPQLVLRAHHIGPWRPWTPTARLKWVPADGWRVDAERTRELVETPSAFANRVRVDIDSLGADWRGHEPLLLAGAVAHLRFDDGTTRERLAARGEWTLASRPRWVAGVEFSRFERTREGAPGADARGYWNPRRYQEARLTTALTHEWRPFEGELRLGLARSREVDAAGNSSRGQPHVWELALAADVSARWRLRASLGGSGQGLGLGGGAGSGAGYWRRWAQVDASAWF